MKFQERVLGASGSISGVASVLGSWQLCHSLCLAAIAALSVIGITITGMPFLFLTEIAVWVWLVALVLLAGTALLYWKKRCISRSLLIVNTGLIVAGIPFARNLSVAYWVVGGSIVAWGIGVFVMDRRRRKECERLQS